MASFVRFLVILAAAYGAVAWSALGVAQQADLREMAESRIGKESRVWFAQPGDQSLNEWEARLSFEEYGIVLNWNAKQIDLLRPDAARETVIPGDYVVRIQAAWPNEECQRTQQSFFERQFSATVTNGSAALKGRLPRWQQRLLLSYMVESLMAQGKSQSACKLFVSMVTAAQEPVPQLLLSTIPIPWSDNTLLESDMNKMQALSEEWMVHEEEAIQLMGAAWLLSGSKRSEAIQKLESIGKQSKSPALSAFARAQLWRTVPPSEVTSTRYPRWLAERDKLLLPTQAGPTMLLADRLAAGGQPNLAIPEWMRIATLHMDRYHLAQHSLQNAANSLRSLNRTEEADRVSALQNRLTSDIKKKP